MPDISILNWRQPYLETSQVPLQRESAVEVMLAVLALKGTVLPAHLKELVKIALWKWTEAEGVSPYAKFNLRFVSRGVLEGESPVSINHEHVQTKKSVVCPYFPVTGPRTSLATSSPPTATHAL
jgi:hypothetical protein